MAQQHTAYSARTNQIIMMGLTVDGFHGDDIVDVAWAEPVSSTEVGPYGDTVTNYSENRMASVTFTLQAGNPLNREFEALAKSKALAPCLIKNTADGTKLAGNGRIQARPGVKYAKTHQPRTWVVTIVSAEVA